MIAIKVYQDGRITLPKKLLRKYTLKTGDLLLIEEQSDGMKLIPAMLKKIIE